MTLNPSQTSALAAIREFLASTDSIFILNGPAGTGKTTLVKSLCDYLREQKTRFALTATTGRAAKVMSAKAGHAAKTIHSLLYLFDEVSGAAKEGEDPWESETGQLFLNFGLRTATEDERPEVIIVDEASMISHLPASDGHTARFGSGHLLHDLLHFAGASKIVFVGDACQLPPVADASLSAALNPQYWTSEGRPTQIFTLTEIVRQQRDNEILQTATLFRNRIERPNGYLMNLPLPQDRNIHATLGKDAFLDQYFAMAQAHGLSQAIAICHSNAQAYELNKLMRGRLHGKHEIQPGDLLMVAQNSYSTNLVNGDQVIVREAVFDCQKAGFSFYNVKVQSLFTEEVFETKLIVDLLYNAAPGLSNDEVKRLLIDFDHRMSHNKVSRNSATYKKKLGEDPYVNALRAKFGYAITVHKAQGGEWDAVFLYLNSSIYSQVYAGKGQKGHHPDGADKYHRWFYTAITRAKQKLIVNDCPFILDFAKRHPAENARYWSALQRAKNATASARGAEGFPKERIGGDIVKILNQNDQGVNGFIRVRGREEQIYFVVSSRSPVCAQLKQGAQVSFLVMSAKNGKGPKANQIQVTG